MANTKGIKAPKKQRASPQERGYAQLWATRDVRNRISIVAKALGSNSIHLMGSIAPLAERLMMNGFALKSMKDRLTFFETVLDVLADPTPELDEAIRAALVKRVAEKQRPIGQQAFSEE